MAEEYGYERSGKKCREKLENLYKYYKKTKAGKQQQDGKHYRFFRQLDALYGSGDHDDHKRRRCTKPNSFNRSSSHAVPFSSDQSLMISFNSTSTSEYKTSSSSSADELDHMIKRGNRKKKWRLKLKECLEEQVRRIMELQEAWLEKMLKALERMEKERILREELWRKQEAARLDREHRDWATQRALLQARDAALLAALENVISCRRRSHDQFKRV